MRLIATFFTLVALAAASLAGKDLHAALSQNTPQVAPEELTRAVAEVAAPVEAPEPLVWPALFGAPEPPKPPQPPAAPVQVVEEPQPPAPPKPPLSSYGYTLKGVVKAGDAVWGLVSHPTGEQIMREGDTLVDDMKIARIDGAGLWVDTGGDDPELLAFPE